MTEKDELDQLLNAPATDPAAPPPLPLDDGAAPPEPGESGDGGGDEKTRWDVAMIAVIAAVAASVVLNIVLVYLIVARDRANLLSIVPGSVTLRDRGATARLHARATNSGGKPVGVEKSLRWQSSAPNIASVDGSGTVTAADSGETDVTAAAGALSATARVQVQIPFSVAVKPTEMTMKVGEMGILSAEIIDTAGAPIADAKVAWVSSDPRVIEVKQGQLTAVGPGMAVVAAAADGLTAAAVVVVSAPVEASPEASAAEATPAAPERPGKGDRHKPAGPSVTVMDVAIKGMVDEDKVRGIVGGYANELRSCSEPQAGGPAAPGKVRVYFNINAVGAVSSCAVTDNTTSNAAVGRCVCQRVSEWHFVPPTKGTVVVGSSFIFAPGE